jgi:GNAT superfamily N-acetyltransferase
MASSVNYTIRLATPEDAQGITRVHVRSWQSSYRGLLAQDFLDNIDTPERLAIWRKTLPQPELFGVYVAVAPGSGELVGFCAGGKTRDGASQYPGELYAIYLLDEVKGQGVGRALFQACRQWLRERGLMPMVLWVLKDNTRARSFYERMGGKLAGEQPIRIGTVSYAEVAYVWEA